MSSVLHDACRSLSTLTGFLFFNVCIEPLKQEFLFRFILGVIAPKATDHKFYRFVDALPVYSFCNVACGNHISASLAECAAHMSSANSFLKSVTVKPLVCSLSLLSG